MMTSSEISQMFASQNQQFMGQQQFAQQIGVTAPNPSLSGWGTPQAMGGQSNFPGMRGGGTPFNYNPGSWGGGGYQGGTRFAGGAMSALGGAASIAGAGLGVASMFGKMGAIAPLVDPFAAGAMGYGMAGVGGAIAGAAVPLGLAYGAGKAVQTFVGGAQQQQAIQSQLGSFHFNNSASRTGQGFTRDDASAIGQSIRSLANVPEMLTSVEELTKLIPKMKSMGVMQGVRDASEFSSRFKDTVKTIRDVSKLLGTTMDEASEFFSASRQNGFLGRQAQLQNVLNAKFTSGVTGQSTHEVMGMQAGGSNFAASIGARRSLGGAAVVNIAQSLGMAQQNGSLQPGLLEDMTGMQGSEAVGAASQRMVEIMGRVAQGPAGRLMMAGMVKFDENGKAVGLDENLVKKFQRGELSMTELKQRAAHLSNKQKISFTARAADLSMSLASQIGPGGIGQFLGQVGEHLYGSEGVNILLQRQGGASAIEADAMQQMGSQVGGSDADKKAFARREARESEIRNRSDPSAILKRLGTKMFKGMGGAWLEESGAKVFSDIGKAYDDFVDDLVGRHIITMSKEGAEKLHAALTGSGKDDLKALFTQASGADKATAGLSRVAKMSSLFMGDIGAAGVDPAIESLKNTDMMASLLGGRSARGQFDHIKDALGTSDMKDADADKMNQYRLGALDKLGQSTSGSFAAFRNEAARLSTGIPGFQDMSDASKADALRKALKNADEDSQTKMAYGLEAAGSIVGPDGDKYMAAAAASGLLNAKNLSGGEDAFSFESTASLSRKIKGAEDEVSSALGPEGAALIKARPEAAKLLRAMQDDPSLITLVQNPTQENLEKLKDKGYNVSLDDLSQLSVAQGKIHDSGDAKGIMGSISKLTALQMKGDISLVKSAASDASSSASDVGLKKALSSMASAGTKEAFQESRDKIQESVASLVDQASKKGADVEKILESAGDLRGAVSAGLSVKSSDIVGKTGADIAKKYHLSAGELAGVKIFGSKRAGADDVAKVQELVERARSADVLTATKSESAGDKDKEMMVVLKKIEKTIDLSTTVMAQTQGLLSKEDTAILDARLKLHLNEKPKTDAKGKVIN